MKNRFLRVLFLILFLVVSLSARAAGTVTIERPDLYKRVLALSDSHGMFKPLRELLVKNSIINSTLNWTAGRTLLVVVGDSIDKGPDSIDVLDLWMNLGPQAEKAGGKLLVLCGNHEAEFLADPENDPKAEALYIELKRKKIPVTELSSPSFPRGAFLRSLPIAARIGKWLFAHAGLFPQLDSWEEFSTNVETLLRQGNYGAPMITGEKSILRAKNWWADEDETLSNLQTLKKIGLTGVVFGHQPKALGTKKIASARSQKLVKIDTGMAPEAGAHPGMILEFADPTEMTTEKSPRLFSLDHQGKREAVLEIQSP